MQISPEAYFKFTSHFLNLTSTLSCTARPTVALILPSAVVSSSPNRSSPNPILSRNLYLISHPWLYCKTNVHPSFHLQSSPSRQAEPLTSTPPSTRHPFCAPRPQPSIRPVAVTAQHPPPDQRNRHTPWGLSQPGEPTPPPLPPPPLQLVSVARALAVAVAASFQTP